MGVVREKSVDLGHFVLLDGMRGVAAFMVVLYHIYSGFGFRLFGSSILAVDFFFMLSGFVIAHSYEQKFQQGFKFKKFMTLRIIRLSPMIIFGALLGLFNYELLCYHYTKTFDISGFSNFLLTLFMIPQNLFGQESMFPLNGVLWSLFFEYVAYILFALFLFKLPTKWLGVLCLLAFGGFIYWSFSVFGVNAPRFDNPGFIDGFCRVIFSFPMGMLIYRLHRKIHFSSPIFLFVLFAGLLLLLSQPRGDFPHYFYALFYTLLAPLVIFLGAKVQISGIHKKLANFMGEVSYPLYQIHFQILWMLAQVLQTYFHNRNELLFLSILMTPLLIGLAYYVSRLYDIPLRNYLKTTFISKQS